MSRWFVGTVPIVNGEPRFGPVTYQILGDGEAVDPTVDVLVFKNGNLFQAFENPEKYRRKDRAHFVGRYLGRLDEGQFGTTGRPAVVVCTGSPRAFQWFRDNASGNSSYDFKTLEAAWQIAAVRDWLIANGMPTIAGNFGPDESITVRPKVPIFCGGNPDPFAPEVSE